MFHVATALLLLTLCLTMLTPVHAGPLAESDRHLVFAHYMVCFGNTVEFYKHEIALAQRHGIDGFALNCGDWLQVEAKTGATKEGPYVKSAERLYQAAKELDSGFKLFFSADVNNLRNLPVNMGDMVTRFATHPNQFRVGEKIVISGWGGSAASYAEAIRTLNAKGIATCFVPFLYSKKFAMAWSPETVARFFDGQPHLDGLFNFAADGTTQEMVIQNAIGCRVAHSLDKIFMAGACPAMNSPNLRDFQGLKGYGAMWEGLIRDDADWVELVTWNDYNEDTNLMADLTANGFRLPTEAEWEYVASGRGEGRVYPWGAAAPVATRGHFCEPAALEATAQVPSTPAVGVMPVGSFSAGASRDGVQDLAGNVSEWCTDWLNPYPAVAQTNPCNQTSSRYRTIRGGSWGYYGNSQRCADREFNNPGYGGYIYIGFRIAINETGWQKLPQ